jgi:hypothetical protein
MFFRERLVNFVRKLGAIPRGTDGQCIIPLLDNTDQTVQLCIVTNICKKRKLKAMNPKRNKKRT